MSGIFAVSVPKDTAGIQAELISLTTRNAGRGSDASKMAAFTSTGEVGMSGTIGATRINAYRVLNNATSYVAAACLYGAPARYPAKSLDSVPPFISSDSSWIITIDGVITGSTGQEVADMIAKRGWAATHDLPGQYAIIGVHRSDTALHWACKAKPLYAFRHATDHYTVITSQEEDLFGFYHNARTPRPFPLGPYTAGRFTREGLYAQTPISCFNGNGSLVLSGGGLDTAIAAWDNQHTYSGEPVVLLNFDYGQKAREKEWLATRELARAMNNVLDADTLPVRLPLDFYRSVSMQDASALTGSKAIESNPQGGQAHEWTPVRNTVLMSLALAYAESTGMARIVTGINLEAAAAYPDNEMEWLNRWRALVPYAVGDSVGIELEAPLVGLSKTDVVRLGSKLGFPWRCLTWSCYNGMERQCGECSSCRTRRYAFIMADIDDPTIYED